MLRVGVHQLPLPQAGLVRALVQLLSRGTANFRWTFAHEAPYDALIVDPNSADLRDPSLLTAAPALSILGPPPGAASAAFTVLEWPLRAERLESWLTSVQQHVAGSEPQACPMNAVQVSEASYRLKRWPPQELLRDPFRIRLATLLSRRQLSLAELVQVSGQEASRCQTFIQMLQGFGLLEVGAADAPDGGAESSSAAPPRAPQRGLIQSIRRRLGI